MAKRQEATPRKTFTVQVTETCADETRVAKLEEIAELDQEIDKGTAKKSAANTEFNSTLKALRKARTDALACLSTGVMKVDVEVYTRVDEVRLEVVNYRCDNDQPIPELTRAMTPAERQMSLDECTDLPPGSIAEEDEEVGIDDEDDDGEAA